MADATFLDVRRLQAEADAAGRSAGDGRGRVPRLLRPDGGRAVGLPVAHQRRPPGGRRSAPGVLLPPAEVRRCRSRAKRTAATTSIASPPIWCATPSAARGRCSTPASRWPTCPRRKRTVDAEGRADVRRAFGRLKPRERALLWLAYAHGSSHSEIADVLGLKTGSIKLLLFRARRKLAATLQR